MEAIHLSKKEKILFLDQLGSLINAGIPIIKGLQIIYFQSKAKKIQSLSRIFKQSVETGSSIAKIAASLPKTFTPFDIAMFEMGDATGQIGKSIETIVNREEKQLELERKIKQALVYPVSIIVVALLMIVTIMTYVIPKIEKIYQDSNVNLPALTEAVISLSRFIRQHGLFLTVLLLVIIGGFMALLRKPKIRYAVDRMILSIPIFGDMIRKKVLIVFSEFLSTLLSSGILINKALTIVRNGLGNAYYERELDAIMNEVKLGKTLSASMGSDYLEKKIKGEVVVDQDGSYARRLDCFPVELSTAVKIGEQTGSISKMLEKTSFRYNKEVDNTIKNLSSMLEPIIIVVIGGIVGVIILAIMLPFFNMVNVIH